MIEPRLALELRAVARAGDRWRTTWRVRSDDARERTLVSAHAPHARFRSKPTTLGVPFGAEVAFELEVEAERTPGPLDTNPFVIVVVRDGDVDWRLLYRLSVTIAPDGTPAAAVGPVTVQRAGFTRES